MPCRLRPIRQIVQYPRRADASGRASGVRARMTYLSCDGSQPLLEIINDTWADGDHVCVVGCQPGPAPVPLGASPSHVSVLHRAVRAYQCLSAVFKHGTGVFLNAGQLFTKSRNV